MVSCLDGCRAGEGVFQQVLGPIFRIGIQAEDLAEVGPAGGHQHQAVHLGLGHRLLVREDLALAEEGARVVVNDYGVTREGIEPSKEPAEEVAAEIKKLGGEAVASYESVADFQAAGRIITTALDNFGRLDILVNNAGIFRHKLLIDMTEEEWDQVIDANLRSAFLCSQAVYPAMKKAGGGKIINIGSMTSIFGGAKLAPYGTSKGGIVQLARSLAAAWAPDNIQVNAILPGWINTDLTKQARKDLAGLDENVKSRTPVRRWGEPQDLAGTAVFLASRASDFVTGVALPVDGGFSIALL